MNTKPTLFEEMLMVRLRNLEIAFVYLVLVQAFQSHFHQNVVFVIR
jgi:hypothetical protein